MTREVTQPVIIIGMHRSGTSLLSRLLEESGLFQGYTKDRYNESLFFQTANEILFRQYTLNWDQPDELSELFADSDKLSLSVEYLRHLLDDDFGEYFWGQPPYRFCGGTDNKAVLWGWKDPRTTVTLPVWLRLFPQSRVIHIIRHGIDVAVSLWRRETNRSRAEPHYSDRCQILQGCFDLWKSYVRIGSEQCRSHDSSVEIYYEDLLSTPEKVMKALFDFLDYEQRVQPLGTLSSIKSNRRFAYMQDNSFHEFYTVAEKDKLLRTLYDRFDEPGLYEHLREQGGRKVVGKQLPGEQN